MSAHFGGASANSLIETLIFNRPQLISLAARILPSRDMAEDVVQDAMLRACDKRLLCPDCPKSFACRMVRNLAVDCLRRSNMERRHCERWLNEGGIETSCSDVHSRLENSELLTLVAEALAKLPERTRNAFLLHRFEGVPQKEIARRLGLSPARIHALIREAHDNCRQEIARLGQV